MLIFIPTVLILGFLLFLGCEPRRSLANKIVLSALLGLMLGLLIWLLASAIFGGSSPSTYTLAGTKDIYPVEGTSYFKINDSGAIYWNESKDSIDLQHEYNVEVKRSTDGKAVVKKYSGRFTTWFWRTQVCPIVGPGSKYELCIP